MTRQYSMRRIQSYLVEMINEKKISNEKGEKRDVLSNLVDANEELLNDGEQRLREEELIGDEKESIRRPNRLLTFRPGNIFIFYLAGHEVRILWLAWVITQSQLCRRRPDTPFVSP